MLSSTTISHPLFICLCVSSGILLILCFIITHQLCSTQTRDTRRFHRTCCSTIYTLFNIISNLLIYSCAFFPALTIVRGISLQGTRVVFEALTIVVGLRLFHWLELSWVELLYKPINASPPNWVPLLFRFQERLCDFAVCVCYALHFVSMSNELNFLFVFYLVLSLRMVLEPLVIIYIVYRIMSILNHAQTDSAEQAQMKRAQTRMQWVVYLGVAITLTAIATIFLLLEAMLHFIVFSYDEVLWVTVMHSVFYMLYVAALMQWIYEQHPCCVVEEGSVCDEYGFCDGCSCCTCCYDEGDGDDGDLLCVGLVTDDTTSRLTPNASNAITSHASTVSVVPSHSVNASSIHISHI